MRIFRSAGWVGLAAIAVVAASCGSGSDAALDEAPSTTATTVATQAFGISIPDGWTIVSPEADSEQGEGEPPGDPGQDVMCPDGSAPRAPLKTSDRVAIANGPSGEFVVYQYYEYESESAAQAVLALWGEGKCELVTATTDGEITGHVVYNDRPVQVNVSGGVDSVAVLMTPEDDSEPTGVLLVSVENQVVLVAVVGGDEASLTDVLNQVGAQY